MRKPEGKGPLEIPRYRWEDNIEMYLKEQDGRAWTGLIWLRKEAVGNMAKKLQFRKL